MPSAARLALLVAVALGSAACQTGGEPSPDMSLSSAGGPASVSAAAAAPEPSGRTKVIAAPSGGFSTPSGNIRCDVVDNGSTGQASAECNVAEHRYQPPPRPAECEAGGDYGRAAAVGGSGPGLFLNCVTDTTVGGPQLAYGESIKLGRFLCTSRTSGVTCKNAQTGHGFELSQDAYRFF